MYTISKKANHTEGMCACTNLVVDDYIWITADWTGVPTYLVSSLLQHKNKNV